MFAAFQLANAAALITALAAPLLIFAYLHRERAKRRVVSSVLVLKSLLQRTRMKKRFVPPPRFFIELTALLLLAFAAALPGWKEPRKRIAVIVDNSLSMRANDGGSMRIGQATSAAESWLGEQESGSQVTVFSSSPKLQRIGEPAVPPAAAVKSIESISPTFSGDSLEVAVADLAQSGDFDSIFVVSDRPAEFVAEGKRDGGVRTPSLDSFFPKQSERTLAETVTYIEAKEIGSRVTNYSLQRLRLSEKGAEGGEPALLASVQLSAGAPAELLLTLFREGVAQSVLTVGVMALPDRTVDVRLPISDSGADAVYRVVVASRSGGVADAIKEDNVAWIAPSKRAQSSALFVSALEGAEGGFGLGAIEGMSVESLSPAAFAQLAPADLERFALLIFHHMSPATAFEKPTLLILPPDQNPLFPVAGKVDAPKIASWVEEHPISSYLKVPLLKPTAALLFATPLWARSVINVEQGAIVVAGESHGLRFAAVGVELLPFGGASTPTVSILTLNLLNWLSGGAELGKATLSGGTTRLEGNHRWKVTLPTGKVEAVEIRGKEPEFFGLKEPGLYRIEGTPSGSGAPVSRLLTANVFYPEEASTFTPTPLTLPREVSHEELVREDVSPIWPMIIAAVLILLSLEALLAAVRGGEAAGIRKL